MFKFEEIVHSLVNLDVERTEELTRAALKEGVPAIDILNQGLIPGMKIIGEGFRKGEIFLPEVLVVGKAMKGAMTLLKPAFKKEGALRRGTVAIGTVKDDIHDIGKNLVIMMLEGTGFRVVDLGVDVSADKFVAGVREHAPQLVAMSALLTTTMMGMRATLDGLKKAGVRDQVKVMIGGAPVTQRFAEEIGADIYAADASSAARKAKEAMKPA
jgi:5-methyltetrahydrofolate--homocysteine methyltransferase